MWRTTALQQRLPGPGTARESAVPWIACVTAAGILTSFGFSCATPFAALAAICALRLRRRDALLVMSVVWLSNQIIGFAYLDYPRDPTTLAWGGVLLAAALAATEGAALVEGLLRGAGAIWRGGLAVAVAYVAVQLVIAFAGVFLHGDAFSLAVQRELIALNAVTFGALLALGRATETLLARHGRTFPNPRSSSSHPSGDLPV